MIWVQLGFNLRPIWGLNSFEANKCASIGAAAAISQFEA